MYRWGRLGAGSSARLGLIWMLWFIRMRLGPWSGGSGRRRVWDVGIGDRRMRVGSWRMRIGSRRGWIRNMRVWGGWMWVRRRGLRSRHGGRGIGNVGVRCRRVRSGRWRLGRRRLLGVMVSGSRTR
ncbi:hypothetical protein BV20DRAFT_329816 [Pilatotrama ljubarskyi]|nr:hypothetical protein BV20DRAFT_329816 [Pilatotrama ljubarskyi]